VPAAVDIVSPVCICYLALTFFRFYLLSFSSSDCAMMTQKTRSFTPQRWVSVVAAAVAVLCCGWLATHFVFVAAPALASAPLQLAVPGTFRPTKDQLAGLDIAAVQAMDFRAEHITDGIIAVNDDSTTAVFSHYSGRVTKLYAKLGDVVQKGAALMAVDASESVQAQSDLMTAAASVGTAQAQVQLMAASEQRQQALFLAKVGAQKDWLSSQADLGTAQNNLRSAQAAQSAVRSRLRILGTSDAQIKALEAAPDGQNTQAEALVRAPIGGTVMARQVGAGQFIQSVAGGAVNPVYSISDLSTVWLVANVREGDMAHMRLGQALEVRVAAWPDRLFKAKIAWISPSIDPLTHRLPVRAEIDNRDGALKPMMFASFRILTGDASTGSGIAQNALVYEGNEAHVFVARPDGLLVLRQVRTGRVSESMVEIVDGLAVGEQVVTRGALFIDRAAEGN
jgi:cobalt-zinc-cadmium efflux system membrane fusion protein